MMKLTKKTQSGYTIVELLIASTVFTIVLLLCAFAIIHIGRMYYRGTIINRTQEVSRRVADDITQSIRFGEKTNSPADFYKESAPTAIGGVNTIAKCVGGIRYTYTPDRYLGSSAAGNQSPHVLWRDRKIQNDCVPVDLTQTVPSVGGEEMVSTNMRVPYINVTNIGELWSIDLRVSYGDLDELFETGSNYGICKGTNAGGQFCAVSNMFTNAKKRL